MTNFHANRSTDACRRSGRATRSAPRDGVIGPSIAQSAREIGNVSLVKVWAQGTAPQDSRGPLYRTDDVVADETVETIEDAGLPVRFLDDTKLWLGSASRATLDSFVFDPDSGPGEMVAAAAAAVRSPGATMSTTSHGGICDGR